MAAGLVFFAGRVSNESLHSFPARRSSDLDSSDDPKQKARLKKDEPASEERIAAHAGKLAKPDSGPVELGAEESRDPVSSSKIDLDDLEGKTSEA